jgi:hypothetical protein
VKPISMKVSDLSNPESVSFFIGLWFWITIQPYFFVH